ncbi:alpha/beta hydrolase [Brevibacterium daeguense]|uniref:Alpha/beta hydrolase n=1 Tax=Brevibacterium daeguense TaxID=909936 RepID=A0ABP8EGX4_9MICO|nr:alpha/beta hydrolase [Brevibacterium daeguense]
MGKKVGRFRGPDGRAAYIRAYRAAVATLPTPSDSFDVRTSLGSVHGYRWTGADSEAVPVALIPGRSAGAPMWADNLASILRAGRTVYVMDAVGDAGLSEQSAPLTAFADQAIWIEEAFQRLGVDRVHTVGHSFGAATAAVHAVHHPERVATLALLEPAFVLRRPPAATFLWATLAIIGPKSWREHALAKIGGVDVADVRARTPVGEMISAGAQHYDSSGLPTPRPLSRTHLERLTMPVYVAIAGDRSLAGGERAAARARTLADATVDVWPSTTHSLPMQVPEELALRLRSFWDRSSPVTR